MKKGSFRFLNILAGSALVLSLFGGALQVGAAEVNVGVKTDLEVKGNSTQVKIEDEDEVKASSSKSNSGSVVSAEAREVRGWDDKEKKDFLATVKTEAQLRSDQDLDNFAKGVMLKDENVAGAEADEDSVEVRYKLPAKFLGIFTTGLDAITDVKFESDKQGRGPKEVTVKFPWYRMFFSLDDQAREDILQAAIEKRVQVEAQYPRDNHFAQNGVTINLISSILKGIRAKLSATTTVEVK